MTIIFVPVKITHREKFINSRIMVSYLNDIEQAQLLPNNPEQLRIILDAYLLEKAIYEIGYELNNRPDWLRVPLQGILQLMQAEK